MVWGARWEGSLCHAGPRASFPSPKPTLGHLPPVVPFSSCRPNGAGHPARGPRVRPVQTMDMGGGPRRAGLLRLWAGPSSTDPLLRLGLGSGPRWVSRSPLRGPGAIPRAPRSRSTKRPSGTLTFPGDQGQTQEVRPSLGTGRTRLPAGRGYGSPSSAGTGDLALPHHCQGLVSSSPQALGMHSQV